MDRPERVCQDRGNLDTETRFTSQTAKCYT